MRLAPHDVPDFLTLAAERLRPEPPHADEALANPRGDHSLDDVPLVHPLTPKPAAVLVPVVMREEPMLLLTERAAHLRQHSGQIAFPGGRVDPTDASVLAAACREADGGDRPRQPLHQPARLSRCVLVHDELSRHAGRGARLAVLRRSTSITMRSPTPSRCRSAFSWTRRATSFIPASGRAESAATMQCRMRDATSGA